MHALEESNRSPKIELGRQRNSAFLAIRIITSVKLRISFFEKRIKIVEILDAVGNSGWQPIAALRNVPQVLCQKFVKAFG